MAPKYILAIDQGTTSSRAILFDRDGEPAGVAQAELPQHYPDDGWVEHDADRIWDDTVAVVRGVIDKARARPEDVAAIGITNQRETAVIWNRKTGAPIHRAIVWQDRRTAELCRRLNAAGHGKPVQERTGLLRDISELFAKERMNVTAVQTQHAAQTRGSLVQMELTVEVDQATRLPAVLAQIARIAGVRSARRR